MKRALFTLQCLGIALWLFMFAMDVRMQAWGAALIDAGLVLLLVCCLDRPRRKRTGGAS